MSEILMYSNEKAKNSETFKAWDDDGRTVTYTDVLSDLPLERLLNNISDENWKSFALSKYLEKYPNAKTVACVSKVRCYWTSKKGYLVLPPNNSDNPEFNL